MPNMRLTKLPAREQDPNVRNCNFEEVSQGYTDLIGLPLYCSGVSTICTGWYNTQRRFSISDYIPRSGGKQPNRRYLSTVTSAGMRVKYHIN